MMDKYRLKGLVIIAFLLFYSFGIATSIVSIALDIWHIIQIGHVVFDYLLDVFLQVYYVILVGYVFVLLHEDLNEKQECSHR